MSALSLRPIFNWEPTYHDVYRRETFPIEEIVVYPGWVSDGNVCPIDSAHHRWKLSDRIEGLRPICELMALRPLDMPKEQEFKVDFFFLKLLKIS